MATTLAIGNAAHATNPGWKLTGMVNTKISANLYGDGSSAVTSSAPSANNPLQGTSDATVGSASGSNGANISYDFTFQAKYVVAGVNPGAAPTWVTTVTVAGYHDNGGWGMSFDGGGINLFNSVNRTVTNNSGGSGTAEQSDIYHTSNSCYNFSPHSGADSRIEFTVD